jgi:hypothetical protein
MRALITNREDLAAPRLLEWHREKAGTIKRVHDVLKKELGAGVLPCGRPRCVDFRRRFGYNHDPSFSVARAHSRYRFRQFCWLFSRRRDFPRC